jgi:PadR family transcriptional regulator PadR
MVQDIRLSAPTLKVLKLFVENPRLHRSGAEISKETGLSSGTLYPLLARLEEAGWLASEWEKADPARIGRPRRRFYTITGEGVRCTHVAFTKLIPSAVLA